MVSIPVTITVDTPAAEVYSTGHPAWCQRSHANDEHSTAKYEIDSTALREQPDGDALTVSVVNDSDEGVLFELSQSGRLTLPAFRDLLNRGEALVEAVEAGEA